MAFRMSDRTQSLAVDDDPPPIDWHSATPTLDLRWFVGAALLMPLLLAVGVYWLHNVPVGLGSRESDSVVEVRLITVPEPSERPTVTPPQSNVAPARPSEPLVFDPNRSIPEDKTASLQSRPGQESQPAATSAPASSAAPVRTTPTPIAATFQRTLLSHIARYRRYPDQARRDHMQGVVQLVFAMRRDGTVTDVWVKTSSGYHTLDLAAVETIHNAQPLPKIPSELPESLNISMPVAFNLP